MSMLGVIGGSGLYDLPGLHDVQEQTVETPFDSPSSPIVSGTLAGTPVAFIARHGRGHILNPSEVPYRANVYAFRSLGVTHILSVSAVGSLQDELPPGCAVIPDQIIDRTVSRDRTFFENGIVAHAGLADPFCGSLRHAIHDLATAGGNLTHEGGTYLCIEGPQFSTRAESRLYRTWGASIIGMTAMPEARLAREAGMCYGMLAMVTDYDVWHKAEGDVSVETVMRVLKQNVEIGRSVIAALAARGLPTCDDGCASALDAAITTARDAQTEAAVAPVALFLNRS